MDIAFGKIELWHFTLSCTHIHSKENAFTFMETYQLYKSSTHMDT